MTRDDGLPHLADFAPLSYPCSMSRTPKAKPFLFSVPWFFVVRVADLSTVYYGQDQAKARACLNEGMVLASGDTFGAAERLAAMEAGKRKTALADETNRRRS